MHWGIGTENLLEYVTTMVGVAVRGKPVLGVIHRPFQEETYWAVVGHGHSLNLNKAVEHFADLPVGVNKNSELSHPLRLIVSRSHAGNVQNYTGAVLGSTNSFRVITAAGAGKYLKTIVRDKVKFTFLIGLTGYKVLEVIGDRADVYVHVTAIKKWDLCAGYAIISALQGSMTTLNGHPIDFGGETEPLNTNGILATMKSSAAIIKLQTIQINE